MTKTEFLVNESDPRSDVHYLGSSENKAWKKNSGLYGIHDLCDTGADPDPVQAWIFFFFFFFQALFSLLPK